MEAVPFGGSAQLPGLGMLCQSGDEQFQGCSCPQTGHRPGLGSRLQEPGGTVPQEVEFRTVAIGCIGDKVLEGIPLSRRQQGPER